VPVPRIGTSLSSACSLLLKRERFKLVGRGDF
jgi:hypothetical protein